MDSGTVCRVVRILVDMTQRVEAVADAGVNYEAGIYTDRIKRRINASSHDNGVFWVLRRRIRTCVGE